MAKKKQEEKEVLSDYYELKTDAAEELAHVYTEEEKRKLDEENKNNPVEKNTKQFKSSFLSKIPTPIKACFFKYWTFGAICYFFYWGLGYYVTNMENLTLIVGIATGMLIDVLLTSAFLYFESDQKEYHPYLLCPVPFKKLWSLAINIPVYTIHAFSIYYVYYLINRWIEIAKNLPKGTAPLSVEPLLYGLIALVIDMIIVGIKDLFVLLFKKIKEHKQNKVIKTDETLEK
ncbi:MAG: hypothetical protein K6G38_06505 [Gammaproteobacteria bacterium]|nr:hypothetical protein [Gammaproteobacteria bacterium]